MTDTAFTHLFIIEQILLDNGNAAEHFCVLVLPVLLKFIKAHALFSVHQGKDYAPHSTATHTNQNIIRAWLIWKFLVSFLYESYACRVDSVAKL